MLLGNVSWTSGSRTRSRSPEPRNSCDFKATFIPCTPSRNNCRVTLIVDRISGKSLPTRVSELLE
jgi:hypothetical protein